MDIVRNVNMSRLKDLLSIIWFLGIMILFNCCLTIPALREIWINNNCLIIEKILIEIFIGFFLFLISFIIAGLLTFDIW